MFDVGSAAGQGTELTPDIRAECEVAHMKYDIAAQHGAQGWLGSWHCRTCNTVGGSNLPARDANDALVFARLNLRGHHGATHTKAETN